MYFPFENVQHHVTAKRAVRRLKRAPPTPRSTPSKKRPRPEVIEGFNVQGILTPDAIGVLKGLQFEVNPITGELYSRRDAAARCNVSVATVAYHWELGVGETHLSETPRKEGCRREAADERRGIIHSLMLDRETRGTAYDVCLRLYSEHQIDVHPSTVYRDLEELGCR